MGLKSFRNNNKLILRAYYYYYYYCNYYYFFFFHFSVIHTIEITKKLQTNLHVGQMVLLRTRSQVDREALGRQHAVLLLVAATTTHHQDASHYDHRHCHHAHRQAQRNGRWELLLLSLTLLYVSLWVRDGTR